MLKLAGVVLCGGAGRRMGGDKATLSIGGVPMAVHVATRVAQIADPVLLARGDQPPLPGPFESIPDAEPGAGPLAGIVAALRAVEEPALAVVAGDMPHASPDVLRLLAEIHALEDAIIPVDDAGAQPLHAIYARSALGPLERALSEGVFSVREVLGWLDVRLVPPTEWGPADPTDRFGANVNTPSDLEDLL